MRGTQTYWFEHTFSDLGNVIFGLLEILVHQSEMTNQLNIVIMRDFSLAVVTNSIRSRYSKVLNASQKIRVCYHVSTKKIKRQ